MHFASLGCVLVLALPACGRSPDTGAPASSTTYTLMQMNLCLSHLAGCYGKVAYPAVVEEAVARIGEAHPDAVTFNEACSGDVALIARRTRYHVRFSRVIYLGEALACMQPGGRGLFGNAVLTKAAVRSAESRPFQAQAGIEQRRWLCVTTRVDVDVCTAHLATRQPDEVAANDPQCAELRALLARRAAASAVIFGGDVNRRSSCAPEGFWTRTDASAEQAAGRQHVYGKGARGSPSTEVLPATHTDHDILLVRAQLERTTKYRHGDSNLEDEDAQRAPKPHRDRPRASFATARPGSDRSRSSGASQRGSHERACRCKKEARSRRCVNVTRGEPVGAAQACPRSLNLRGCAA